MTILGMKLAWNLSGLTGGSIPKGPSWHDHSEGMVPETQLHVALIRFSRVGLFDLFMSASLKTTSILLAGWEFAYVENQRKCSKLEPYAY